MNNKLTNLRFLNFNKNISELEFLTKFNYINNLQQHKIKTIILTFSFKDINFNEDKVLPFFLALELITNQKSSITLSKKPSVKFQIKKGTLSGCKVTLRKKNLYKFLDYLNITLPRLENFKPLSFNQIKKNTTNTLFINLQDLFSFYQLEAELDQNIKLLQILFIFNSNLIEEKIFSLSSYNIPIKE